MLTAQGAVCDPLVSVVSLPGVLLVLCATTMFLLPYSCRFLLCLLELLPLSSLTLAGELPPPAT